MSFQLPNNEMPYMIWAGVEGCAHKAHPVWSPEPLSRSKLYLDAEIINRELRLLREENDELRAKLHKAVERLDRCLYP